jgi:hypothetical protein
VAVANKGNPSMYAYWIEELASLDSGLVLSVTRVMVMLTIILVNWPF